MDSRKKVLVLGGNVPHRTLIHKLKLKGYFIVLIDYLDNPPAKSVADEHIQISTLDKEKVLEVARKVKPEYIVNVCNDQAITTAAYVAEKLGVSYPYGYETSLNITDKGRMKRIMRDNCIPTACFIHVNEELEGRSVNLNYPLVVKPSDTTGSKGVKKVTNDKALSMAVKDALNLSPSHSVIVEEFIPGKEFQIDCFIQDGLVDVIMIRQKLKFVEGEISSPLGSLIQINLPETERNLLYDIATRISKAFGINNNTLFMQVIMNGNEINVIEFGVRIGGGWSYKMIKEITGFDYLEAAMNSILGIKTPITYSLPQEFYMSNFLFSKEGVFEEVVGLQELKEEGAIDDFEIFLEKGRFIDGVVANRNRVAIYLVKGKTLNVLFEKVHKVLDVLDIHDCHKNSLLYKSMYDMALPVIEKNL